MPDLPISDGAGVLTDRESEGITPFMTHPSDEGSRRGFIALMRAQTFLPLLELLPPESTVRVPVGDLRSLMRMALDARPPQLEMQRLGMLVSDILVFNLICARDHPELVGVKRAIYAISGRQMSQRSLMNRWVKYKPVAHLWAAVWHWKGPYSWETPTPIDPSWVKDPEARLSFLAVAEHFRLAGENTYAHGQKRRGNSILDSSETWKVPDDLALPKVTVELPKIPGPLLNRFRKYRPSDG